MGSRCREKMVDGTRKMIQSIVRNCVGKLI